MWLPKIIKTHPKCIPGGRDAKGTVQELVLLYIGSSPLIPVRYGAVNKWASRVYHGYQQDLSQPRSALPILPSTQRPDFQSIYKRLLSKSACLRGSAPDPAEALQRPQTPSWKRLVLTTLLKIRSRATEITRPFPSPLSIVCHLVI